MYYLNKIVGSVISPVGLAFAFLLLGLLLNGLKKRGRTWAKGGKGWMVLSVLWLWSWSTPLMTQFVAVPLERAFLVDGKVPRAAEYPKADAIVLLGGGMGINEQLGSHDEMWASADRVWMAAQLFRAGKAPKIYATGGQVEQSTRRLLNDLGVPSEAIIFDDSPRNTEEEAKAAAARAERTILLVTSAWHMKRAQLMFARYAPQIKVIPTPRDFENLTTSLNFLNVSSFFPDPAAFLNNSIAFREWIGFFGYKFLRR